MLTEAKKKIWQDIFENKKLAEKILVLDPKEAVAVLKENGFELSEEDMNEAAVEINKVKQYINENGELSEKDLLDVAGGGIGSHIGSFFAGVLGGLLYYTSQVPW